MKKIFKLLLLILFIASTTPINVSAASNPYKQAGPYGTNCTWYAWKMVSEKGGVTLPGWGNAKDWYNDAKNDGYSVGTTPASNSIIVWGNWTSYGHVGYVERVEGDTLHVWDSTGPCIDEEDPTYKECMANGVSEESDRACKAAAPRIACKYSISESSYTITGYVYLNNAPKKSQTTKSTSTAKKTETKKSNNANLASIEINVGTINFAKDIFEYEIEVENVVKNISINATTEHKKATVEGTGEHELKVGLNELKLTVTAEDKSEKEYLIKVTRKEENKNTEQKVEKVEQKKNDKKTIMLATSFIVFTTCLIFILKRKKLNNK